MPQSIGQRETFTVTDAPVTLVPYFAPCVLLVMGAGRSVWVGPGCNQRLLLRPVRGRLCLSPWLPKRLDSPLWQRDCVLPPCLCRARVHPGWLVFDPRGCWARRAYSCSPVRPRGVLCRRSAAKLQRGDLQWNMGAGGLRRVPCRCVVHLRRRVVVVVVGCSPFSTLCVLLHGRCVVD